MYKEKGGGGSSRSEVGGVDRKKLNDVSDKHLERASPSTSRGRFPAPSTSTGRTPANNREFRSSASTLGKNKECSDGW